MFHLIRVVRRLVHDVPPRRARPLVAAVVDVRHPRHSERGQTTAEYALVLLGAAAIALLLLAWATQTDAIGGLLDMILDQIRGRVT